MMMTTKLWGVNLLDLSKDSSIRVTEVDIPLIVCLSEWI